MAEKRTRGRPTTREEPTGVRPPPRARGVRPKVRDDLVLAPFDDGAVAYDPLGDHVHHLNAEAALLFDLFDGTATVRECAREIAAEFGIPEGRVERQVRSLLRDFKQAGLLRDGVGELSTIDSHPDHRERVRQEVPRST
jgi:PqqD family protein of HPr-rel-A system